MEATKPAAKKAAATKQFPLVYNYAFPVSGNGFLVHITLRGRILMEQDGDDVWMYGVNPGGFSIFAATFDAALETFTARLHEVMNGVAESTQTFAAFKKEVEELFATNEDYAKMWQLARQAVREGKTNIEGMNREENEYDAAISIEKVTNPNPAINVSEKKVALASFGKAA